MAPGRNLKKKFCNGPDGHFSKFFQKSDLKPKHEGIKKKQPKASRKLREIIRKKEKWKQRKKKEELKDT